MFYLWITRNVVQRLSYGIAVGSQNCVTGT